jgi:tRNA threonylcarbamoyladenosine biosynthesis protein TsaB
MINVLAFDTSSPAPALALVAGGRLFEEPLPPERRASEELLPALARLLAAAAIRLEECAILAVCSGPGSFTGVRVGLATVWGLSRALGIPVEPVPTLEAMAEASRGTGPEVTCVLDAGRGELVAAAFSLGEHRARSLGPVLRAPAAQVARLHSSRPMVSLPAGLGVAAAVAPPMRIGSGLALAVARAPRPATSSFAAIYSRPSAAEEKHGAT